MQKLKCNEFQVAIPILRNESTFRTWEEAVVRYLGSLKLRHYLEYEIVPPQLLLSSTEQLILPDFDDMVSRLLPRNLQDLVCRLPSIVREAVCQACKVFVFNKDVPSNIPRSLVKLVLKSTCLIVADCKLFIIVENAETCLEMFDQQNADMDKVYGVLYTTVSQQNLQVVKSQPTVFGSYQALVLKFRKDLHLELKTVRRKFSSLRCPTLTKYLADFITILAEYESLGGNRYDTGIADFLVDNIPNDRYEFYKHLYRGKTVDEGLEYFKQIAQRESLDRYRAAPVTKRVHLNQLKHSTDSDSETLQCNTVVQCNTVKVKKCIKCGGWGHTSGSCPTPHNVCHECGDSNHFKNKCDKFLRRVKAQQILCDHLFSDVDEHSAALQNSDTKVRQLNVQDTEECDDVNDSEIGDTAQEFASAAVFFKLQVISVIVNKLLASSPCSCSFGSECLSIVIDSGATRHIVNENVILSSKQQLSVPVTVENAFGVTSTATLQGTLSLQLLDMSKLSFHRVLQCSAVSGVILSIRQLIDDGFAVNFNHSGCYLITPASRVIPVAYIASHGSYLLHAKISIRVQCNQLIVSNSDVVHTRFGHLSHAYLRRAGLDVSDKSSFCAACASMKLVKAPGSSSIDSQNTKTFVARSPIEKLHIDTCGPFPSSIHREKFLVVIVDAWTSYIWTIPVNSKSNIPQKLMELFKNIQQRFRASLRVVFTDNGTEFVNAVLTKFTKQHGINHEHSSVSMPSENGKAERSVRTIKDMTKVLLFTASFPAFLWAFAAVYASHILNVIPRPKETLSPFTKLHKAPPDMARFKVFGSPGYFKLTPRIPFKGSIVGRFIGFSSDSKEYLMWLPKRKVVQKVRDIVLDEKIVLVNLSRRFKTSAKLPLPSQTPPKFYPVLSNRLLDTFDRVLLTVGDDDQSTPLNVDNANVDLSSKTNSIDETPPPSSLQRPDLSEISSGNIVNYPRTRTTVESYRSLRIPSDTYFSKLQVCLTTTPPKSFFAISQRKDADEWYRAYSKELSNLEKIGDMCVVDRPPSTPVVPILELFTTKVDSITNKLIAKVRVVARGDLQQAPEDLYAPVASLVAFRIFFVTGNALLIYSST